MFPTDTINLLPAVSSHMRFDHAGIATDDADALAELYSELFNVPIVDETTDDGMYFVFLSFGNGDFEVIEPLDDGSPVARYVDEHGPGIHHLAVATEDATAALERARELGIELVDEEPREGARGHDIAFLHPRDTGGVLVEFVEH